MLVQSKAKEGKIIVAGATTPTIHQLATWEISRVPGKIPSTASCWRWRGDWSIADRTIIAVEINKFTGIRAAQMATQLQREK
jgi:hypothetical protein